MRIDIMTLFPDTVSSVLHESIIGRAAKKGIVEINCLQIRDYTENKQNQVDDYPYGGGWGCVMMAQPLKSCLDAILASGDESRTRVIYMSPQGKPFNQETAKRLSRDYDRLVLVCGHYEGIDERFIEKCVDEEISLGDFVLTGGEIAAMAVADSVCRLIPGVLSDEQCYTGESHWDGLLEYPQYTRPEVWEGMEVPGVLLGGNSEKIDKWRRKKQLERTRDKRPDMFERFTPETDLDKRLAYELQRDEKREKIVKPLSYRPAAEEDIPEILEIVEYSRSRLREFKVDQWQEAYPDAEAFLNDIRNNECYIVLHGEKTAGFFTLQKGIEETYNDITDGKWSNDDPYCTIHRLAVGERYRGTEIAEFAIRCAENRCVLNGCNMIRADTHRKNKPMQKLLRESGFVYRGNIEVNAGPGHDRARQAYEKLIKRRER